MAHRPARIVAFTAMLLISAAAVGCAEMDSKDPVVVGYLGGLSGRSSALGLAGRDGALLAVEEINAAGGVGGRPVTLEVADDGAGNDASISGMRQLADAGAIAVIGPLTSVSASAAAPVADEVGLPMLSPTVSSTDFSGQDDQFLRTCADNQRYASMLASEVVKAHGPVRVAVVYDLGNRSYTESLYTHFAQTLESAGGEVSSVTTFTSGQNPDYKRIAREAAASKPGAVFVAANAIDTALISQRLRLEGVKAPIALSHWAATDDLVSTGGSAVEKALFLNNYDKWSAHPPYVSMRTAFEKRFGYEPNFAAIHSFDATKMLLKAVAADPQRASTKSALLELGPYAGIQGTIELDRNGDTVRPFFLTTIVNGAFEATGTP